MYGEYRDAQNRHGPNLPGTYIWVALMHKTETWAVVWVLGLKRVVEWSGQGGRSGIRHRLLLKSKHSTNTLFVETHRISAWPFFRPVFLF